MPFFNVELNRIANDIGASDLTIYLHTEAPTDAAPTNGRVTTGGGLYQTGAPLPSTGISDASEGDIHNTVAVAFGESAADIGILVAWSAYRATAPVAYGTLPNTEINTGDTFTMAPNTLLLNGSTT